MRPAPTWCADWAAVGTVSRQESPIGSISQVTSPGPDLFILGSGSIVGQLADAGLIDEYQIVTNPIVLEVAGRSSTG